MVRLVLVKPDEPRQISARQQAAHRGVAAWRGEESESSRCAARWRSYRRSETEGGAEADLFAHDDRAPVRCASGPAGRAGGAIARRVRCDDEGFRIPGRD